MTTTERNIDGGVSVITVARTMAAGAETIALHVALELGYRYIDDEIVIAAAQEAGVSPDVIEAVETDNEGFMQRVNSLSASTTSRGGLRENQDLAEAYASLIRDVIVDFANRGRAVIVAHGAGLHLAGRLDALRILVTGSQEGRAARLAEKEQVPLAEAREAVIEADHRRDEFLRNFYNKEHEHPTDYDLIVNTDLVAPRAAARSIIALAGPRD
jgi:cytidylate kinase